MAPGLIAGAVTRHRSVVLVISLVILALLHSTGSRPGIGGPGIGGPGIGRHEGTDVI